MKNIEMHIRRFLLVILLLFKKKKVTNELPVINKNSKILFIRLNKIGDALITTPLLKLIKGQTGCKIYVLASRNNHFVFDSSNFVDEIIVFKKNLRNIPSLIKLINSHNFDAIVDLHDDVSSTVSYLMAFTKSKYKFGLQKSNDKLFTHTVNKLDPSRFHIIERVMEFGKLFQLNNVDSTSVNISYTPRQQSILLANTFLENHFTSKKFLLGINISASNDARFWGVSNYRNLIDELVNYKFNILLMCAETELQHAVAISENKIPIYYPNFDEFCAIIPKLDLLFTPDTSIVHVASAFNTPVFGLYVKYNTTDKIWSPYKSQFDYVVTEEPTLHNISFESVKKKFIPFLEKLYYEYTNKKL